TPLAHVRSSCFLSSPDHLDLPSFPTRRSSDLPESTPSPPCAKRGRPYWRSTPGGRCCSTGRRCWKRRTKPGSQWRVIRRKIEMEDRKSTRLNSSHEWISYAVFCLKKKKR